MIPRLPAILILCLMLFAMGCANIVAPTGGDKDITPPKLVKVSPADSQLNVRTGKVRFDFDEYIVVTDAANQILISPILPVPPTVASTYKHVTISFPDSLLQDNTTYHISLGTAVRDNHEGNIYRGRDFLFSTGTYFDSLRLSGRVINAATGLPDSTATILLYNIKDGDSALLHHKPFYAMHADASGSFNFTGLPQRTFHIYALQDKNGNLIYDAGTEWIGFIGTTVTPGKDSLSIALRTFPGKEDTVAVKADPKRKGNLAGGQAAPGREINGYIVMVDTGDIKRRTKDIDRPLSIAFGKAPSAINNQKIFLSYDSASITVEAATSIRFDSLKKIIEIATPWLENAVYTLRLQKGFAKDSAGADVLPGRFTFRTKRDEDYAKLNVHLPGKYFGAGYLLQVSTDADTVYQRPVLDSMVKLIHLTPGNYKLRVIEDKNGNGHWDTGDLFGGLQPEIVVPYDQVIMLKPGWENEVDFERTAKPNRKSPEKSPPIPVK